ncbi:FAD-dependent oxidoreductase [Desulfobacula toluolica]|uniref:Fumarate reductase/succinate dehydrogenase flavoprotein domain protein n=1 Tax=Desulfobacula toluolica (strain DSM 7467 / Tol2) TaxID=651182 RepID=K0NKC4_DESTT|nr:FAD-dependent oxidoreductase [Desulfobacula toluolica]CCK82006.1 fumarate reductase/succinate dehydrogenase flavoprotein domain protein [Desulfobacula toluolica Tol2]
MKKFDAIIVGAGIAGLSSALTAVNSGMRTALVEKNHYLGGIAQDCFHTYICGLFQNDRSKPFQIANPGICSDIFKFLRECYGDKSLVKIGKVETLAFIQKDLWGYFSKHLKKNNFTFLKKSKCIKVMSENKKIQSITIAIEHGTQKKNINLYADIFIDATGNGYFSDKTLENNSQLGGYCILLDGCLNKDLSLIIPYTARKIIKEYELNEYLKFITITYNFLTKKYILKFSVKNHEDVETCQFIYEKLNKNIKELSQLKFIKASENIHLRSYSNIQANTLINHKTHDRDIAVKSYWPTEKWDINKGTQYQYCKKDKPFCIPVSALKDDKIHNLFLAGKNIRVSEQIHASARVMGVCMATGEQAVINALKYLKTNNMKALRL